MDRIRPSLGDLAKDYDQLAFPELQPGDPPAAKVSRVKPPTIGTASSSAGPSTPSTGARPAGAKPKSRFALQREREAAERFQLDLDTDSSDPSSGYPNPLQSLSRLVGEVKEREVGAVIAPSFDAPPPVGLVREQLRPTPESLRKMGFPASPLMALGGGAGRTGKTVDRPTAAPVSRAERADLSRPVQPHGVEGEVQGLLESAGRENEGVLAGMTEREILEEQKQIRESMGLSESVLQMLMARKGAKTASGGDGVRAPAVEQGAMPKTRIAPGRAPLLQAPAKTPVKVDYDDDEEEGTPEYIRRHFFPNEPANPNLAWMNQPPSSNAEQTSLSTTSTTSGPSFSLQGDLLSTSDPAGTHSHSATGDHHVSSSSSFTASALLHLTGSAVPSQRSTAFLVLHRILSKPSNATSFSSPKEWDTLHLTAATKAGRALRDPNPSVAANALLLLGFLVSNSPGLPAESTTLQLEGAEVPPTIVTNFLSTEPFASLAAVLHHSSLPDSSFTHVLYLLEQLVHLTISAPHQARTMVLESLVGTPGFLEGVSKRLIALSWPISPPTSTPSSPSKSAALPKPSAIAFLSLLAKSSKSAAESMWDRNLIEPSMRFLALLPWELEASSQKLGWELLDATLELWTTLARYGVGTSLRTKAASLLVPLLSSSEENPSFGLVLELLRVWTTAAIDPHVTDHDILWSHVEDWNEIAAASHLARRYPVQSWGLLAAWLEGSKINKPRRGDQERAWAFVKLGEDFGENGWAKAKVEEVLGGDLQDEGELRAVVAGLVLSQAFEEESEPETPALLPLNPELVERAFDLLVHRPILGRHSTELAVRLLLRLPDSNRFAATLAVINHLKPGDEVVVRDLTSWIMRQVEATLPRISSTTPALASLRPFVTHAIVASSGGRVTSPLYPTPKDVKLAVLQHPFASSSPLLKRDWPLLVLDELLRSGSSKVIDSLPKDWDGSELGLVRGALQLMEAVAAVESGAPPPAVLVYDMIKVFMLEKDNVTSANPGAESDLFRDSAVQASMTALLKRLTLGASIANTPQKSIPDQRSIPTTMEGVSALVSSAPFYSLYTDLIGLYDSISLGHPVFGQVLMPPLAMGYPVDYRRLLWTDYSHLLRTITLSVNDAITDNPGEGALASYLYPNETHSGVLAAYAEALVSKKVTLESTPFLFLIAVHHVAGAVFGEAVVDDAVARKLAGSVVKQGGEGLGDLLVQYDQKDVLSGPPSCLDGAPVVESRRSRLQALLA